MKLAKLIDEIATEFDDKGKKLIRLLGTEVSADLAHAQAANQEEYLDWKTDLPEFGRIIEIQEKQGAEQITFELSKQLATKFGGISGIVIKQPEANRIYTHYGVTDLYFYSDLLTEIAANVNQSHVKVNKENEMVSDIELTIEDVAISITNQSYWRELINRNTAVNDGDRMRRLEEEMEKLKHKNLELEEERLAKLKVMADFQNYRKRMEQEKAAMGLALNRALVNDIVDVLDDITRTIADETKDLARADQMLKIIADKMLATVNGVGIEQIKVEIGDKYDPAFMEAVGTVTVNSVDEHNTVVSIIQPAYKYKDKDQLLRAAKVIVGKKVIK